MEWTTTAKELEASGFRVGLDRIVRDFKYMVCAIHLMKVVYMRRLVAANTETVCFYHPSHRRHDLPGVLRTQGLGNHRFHGNRADCEPDRMSRAVAVRARFVLNF